MKKTIKKAILLVIGGILIYSQGIPVQAEDYTVTGHSSFNGTRIVSDFDNKAFAQEVSNLQPGDNVSFVVTYTNNYKETTDWYMANEVLQTLEKANVRRRTVEVTGIGEPEKGGYTYELIHKDKNGKEEVLFSNNEVGGEYIAGEGDSAMQGLEQATNALDDWFYIQTLNQGESGTVILNVAFDGETEVNDYMDTNGGLAVRFAVELNKTGTTGAKKVGLTAVKTGDPTNFPVLVGGLAAGIVLLIVALILKKKEKQMTDETGGDTE